MAEIQYNATGRRKTSVARVTMTPGNGQITVNKKPADVYFPRETLRMVIRQPIELAGITGKYNVIATVNRRRSSGQAGAVKHGIARAIVDMNSDLRPRLKKEGFLRETREKKSERNTARRAPGRDSSSPRDKKQHADSLKTAAYANSFYCIKTGSRKLSESLQATIIIGLTKGGWKCYWNIL